ncbi:MAG: tRNA (adenosine(37)-N6)-threonylcarbamoyltransferase complex dimerization subunit type 1 TsaB [Gemmatimonadota bacterium]
MITLALESSTYEGSVALLDGVQLLGERVVTMRGREQEALMAAVGELLAAAELSPTAIRRVVCGSGPGSFTSLRISAAIAKGLAMASGAALYPVSSLRLLVESSESRRAGRFLAAVDAMRGESYVQEFEFNEGGSIVSAGALALIATPTLVQLAESRDAKLIGPQQSEGARVVPRASAARHITNMIGAWEPADLAAWEPGYGRLAEAQVKWEAVHGRALQSN